MVRLLLSSDTDAVIEKDELMLEFIRGEVLEKFPSPRILNTHCFVEQLPRGVFEKKCKIIYILRNPKDTTVSLFNHHKKLIFDFGAFFDYMKDWTAVRKTHPELPTLTLMYEDLKEDPLTGIRKLAKILNVEKSEEIYHKVKELTSFNKMKEEEGKFSKALTVLLLCEVGDWKNYFTVAQNEAFDRLYKENMVDSGSFTTYLKDWAAIRTNHPEVPTLTLVYEDLKEDPLAGIRKLAKFLNAEKSEEFYLKVKELTSFNKMKEKKGSLVTAPDGSPVMYRKGEVDDWKNYFTVAQNEAFDRLYKENMAGCDINFR
ncbi:sulfotransferase 1A1-like [Haliotis rubra]|uniref:sulfotransferase 1A1-like n=1 Tax=Haliotis rubra TaxID=36100 RepID=UPI001EE599D7|nr:sulfotransferase 1A1-like [Haliotis rubra]